ncbi:MAG: hypothetical protein R3356_02910 [Eudoraea sp.]|nr:hypothetical protein [Eudoraea sp.]
MKKGLQIVTEGQRFNLRVYRRFFYPIKMNHEGDEFIVYSDTRREREINYSKTDQYGLEDPFSRIRLVKLARALNALKCTEVNGERECRVTICTNRELFDPEAKEINYIPFDPDKLETLEDRIRKARRKIEWHHRMKSS